MLTPAEKKLKQQEATRAKHSAKTKTSTRTYRLLSKDIAAFDVLCRKMKGSKASVFTYLMNLHRTAVKASKL